MGWVNTPAPPKQIHSWDSDSSGDYLVMSIRSKNRTELKVAGAKLPIVINGKKTSVWIDSGSPISISTIGELRKTLGANGIHLKELAPEDQDSRDYGNNQLSFLGNDASAINIKRMGDSSNYQSDWRKPPFHNWPRSYAGIGTTASSKKTGGGGDGDPWRARRGRICRGRKQPGSMAGLF